MKDNRVNLLFFVMLTAFSILIGRSFYLQVLNWKDFRLNVLDMSTRVYKIPGRRGNIYDKNGVLLAWNEKIYQINLTTDVLEPDKEKELKDYLKFSNLDINEIIDDLNFNKRAKVNIPSTTAMKINSLDGFIVNERYIRKYKHESLYHLLGYVDNEGVPRTGIEREFNETLKGKEGYKIVTISPSGHVESSIENIPSIKGNNLYLTIDIELQEKIYNYMEEHNHVGSVIISNPEDGSIYSMVSYPAPNPNDFSRGLTNLEFRRILNDNKSPLLNRSISDSFAPGSVLKPFIAYSALEYGISPEATVNSTGRYTIYNSSGNSIATFDDWNLIGHGVVDLVKSLRVSANSYYYKLGEEIGINFLDEQANKFSLTKETGIDLPGEAEGVFPDEEWKRNRFDEPWYPGETIQAYIGQSYIQMTPLQILRYYNILSENGNYYKFHIYNKTENIFNEKIDQYRKELSNNYDLDEKYLSYILEGLIQVTSFPGDSKNGGTAYDGFKDANYVVAGKTGTAQVSGGKRPHAWFAGYTPELERKYSIVVFIENGGFGSSVAVPIAREFLDLALSESR
ncbi:MAG: penicillin-binding transpeptidase domain-containing protein [Thermotogota bacterium]